MAPAFKLPRNLDAGEKKRAAREVEAKRSVEMGEIKKEEKRKEERAGGEGSD